MLENIQGQPESLRAVSAYQFGEGATALQAAATAIRTAGRVVFTGMGASLYASIPAAAYLAAHGFPAVTVDTSELLHFGSAQDDAALVLVSRSGETTEIVKLLAKMGPRAHPTIGVTNVMASSLARGTAFAIDVHSAADRMVAVQTYTATAATLLLLAAAVLETAPAGPRRALDQAIDALSGAIDSALEAHLEWTDFLNGAGVVYVLGRGPSLASVHAGALLFNEAARLPSVGMSAGLFRHGPVEVVDSRWRAILFASQAATRDLDLALAADLTAMGGRVKVCDGGGAPLLFEPLSEIVPVQVAACALALDRGIDPGDFRYADLVTLSETGFRQP